MWEALKAEEFYQHYKRRLSGPPCGLLELSLRCKYMYHDMIIYGLWPLSWKRRSAKLFNILSHSVRGGRQICKFLSSESGLAKTYLESSWHLSTHLCRSFLSKASYWNSLLHSTGKLYASPQLTLRAQDWSRLRIQSLLYHSQGPLGKDYFRTTIFFPANFVTLLAVIWLEGEHYYSAGMYTPNNIKL